MQADSSHYFRRAFRAQKVRMEEVLFRYNDRGRSDAVFVQGKERRSNAAAIRNRGIFAGKICFLALKIYIFVFF